MLKQFRLKLCITLILLILIVFKALAFYYVENN